jgi:hypothetical protein
MVLMMVMLALPSAVLAGEKIEVAVGETISSAKVTANHNFTMDRLKEGKTDYMVKVGGQEHQITVTKDQVKKILAGTTVHLSAGDKKVRVTMKSEKPKSSGW